MSKVLPLKTILTTSGAGWIENQFEADPDEGETEDWYYIGEVAWCKGTLALEDGDSSTKDYVKKLYGKKYGFRIWTEKPTDEERAAVKWKE